MEVGGVFVRIRPRLSDRDARALEAFHVLERDVTAALDRFYESVGGEGTPGRDRNVLEIGRGRMAAPSVEDDEEGPDAA